MSVEVNLSPILHPYTGNRSTVTVDGGSVGECIGQLVERFPRLKGVIFDRTGKLNSNINIYLNEADAYPDPLSRTLRDGDKVNIVMLIAGG